LEEAFVGLEELFSTLKLRLLVLTLLCSTLSSGRQTQLCLVFAPAPLVQAAQTGHLHVQVLDQNGQPLPSAAIIVQHGNITVFSGATDNSGSISIPQLLPGSYKVVARKQGFYSATAEKVVITAGQGFPLEFRLQPVRTHKEELEVSAQSSPIDPQQISSTQSLNAADIADIPYPTTRDYRNILRFLPGVISDNGGQIHIAGGSQSQTQDYLDSFEVSNPAGGGLGLRLNPDALRKISIDSSRYSAQFGKGSGGLVSLDTQDGDNKFRLSGADFVPTLQSVKGLHLNNWTPRGYFSGPVVRSRAWFMLSHEGENDLNIIRELPAPDDANRVWRTSDEAKFKLSLTPRNTLMASVIANLFDSDRAGISPFNPASATVNQDSGLYVLTLKDQISIAKDSLLEFGVGEFYSRSTEVPQGTGPLVVTPLTNLGNFYRISHNWAERLQGISNLYLHPIRWHGAHQLAFGGQLDRVAYHQLFVRGPVFFTDVNGITARQEFFQNVPAFTLHSVESNSYAQDRWSPIQRLLIESGLRFDHDSYIQRSLVSPRVAGTYLLHKSSETKLSGGVGLYYDRTSLAMLSRQFQGSRTDMFFVSDGTTLAQPPFQTSFVVGDPHRLLMPRFLNWSAGIERKLPAGIYARLDYLSRTGTHGWAYEDQLNGTFLVQNSRQDRYKAVQMTLRKEIKRGYPVLLSYTRSSARTNKFLDFGPDGPVFGSQVGGAMPWDAPNQLVSWGFLPLFKKFDLAYSLLWRSGLPFIAVDHFQRIVAGPDLHRFPDFFTLNPAVERKFGLRGYLWSLRVGLDNVTNSQNPVFVNNVVDSGGFLDFAGFSHRTLNGHIRFLGRK